MDYKVTDTELTSVADTIRSKAGTSSPLVWPTGFSDAVSSIGGSAILGTKTVEGNGTFVATDDGLDGYSSFTVAIADADSTSY